MTPEQVDEVLRTAVRDDQASVGQEQLRGLDLGSLRYPRHAESLHYLARLRPAFAAAAVVLVILLPLLLTSVVTGHRGPSHPPTGGASQPVSAPPALIPPWYAATTATALSIAKNTSPLEVTVRDTYSGAVLATVPAPAPYGTFAFVTGTGRPGVWVVGAQRWQPGRHSAQPVKLLLLTYDGATQRVSTSPLPVPALSGSQLQGVAMSAGGRLAVVLAAGSNVDVRVYALSRGSVRSWQVPPQAGGFPPMPPYKLTWLDDGRTLAMGELVVGPEFAVGDVTYLDTDAADGSSTAARLVTLVPPAGKDYVNGRFYCASVPVPASDGKTVACGGTTADNAGLPGQRVLSAGFGVFSAKSGKLLRVRDQVDLHAVAVSTVSPDVFWSNATGSMLVVTGAAVRSPQAVMLLAPDGTLRALPWSIEAVTPSDLWPALPDVAW
jgi:hypothetical protein